MQSLVLDFFNRHKSLCSNFIAFCLGGLSILAFAPFEYRVFAIFSLFILFLLVDKLTPKRAFMCCYCFGLGLFGFGVSWVFNSLYNFGDAPVFVAILITALLVLIMAIFVGLVGFGLSYYSASCLTIRALVIFPCLWVLHEWLYSWVLTGFPWLLIGYSQVDTVFSSYIPLVGALGVGGIIACVAGSLALILVGQQREKVWGVLVIVACLTGSYCLAEIKWVEPTGDRIRVAVMQGNISQDIKLDPAFLEYSLDRYVTLSRAHYDSKIHIWPETAIPTFKYYVKPFLDAFSKELEKNEVEVLSGIFSMDQKTRRYYNSMYKLGSDQDLYSKQRLVPFGEYMPLRWMLSFLSNFITIPMSDIMAGKVLPSLVTLQGIPVAISICYESAYTEVFRYQLPEAQILVNASNDAWFGDSLAPHQHLEIARVRALEAGRYMLRSTNNGISAIIDPAGSIVARSIQDKQQVLSQKVQGYKGATLYTRLGNFLTIVPVICVLCVIIVYRRFGKSFSRY